LSSPDIAPLERGGERKGKEGGNHLPEWYSLPLKGDGRKKKEGGGCGSVSAIPRGSSPFPEGRGRGGEEKKKGKKKRDVGHRGSRKLINEISSSFPGA